MAASNLISVNEILHFFQCANSDAGGRRLGLEPGFFLRERVDTSSRFDRGSSHGSDFHQPRQGELTVALITNARFDESLEGTPHFLHLRLSHTTVFGEHCKHLRLGELGFHRLHFVCNSRFFRSLVGFLLSHWPASRDYPNRGRHRPDGYENDSTIPDSHRQARQVPTIVRFPWLASHRLSPSRRLICVVADIKTSPAHQGFTLP